MATLMNSTPQKNLGPSDDFERYVKQQQGMTTFNGTEVADFSSYKKLLGLK